MKSVYLIKKGDAASAFEIRESEKPKIGENQVGISVECFGLNYADVLARNGLYKEAPAMPSVIGYEVVGKIDEVGSNVDQDLIGKRVVAFTRFGGYSEYVVTPADAIAEIGDMEAEKAVCIATQFVTAYYMSFESLNLFKGNKVLVHSGAGGVGLALIQMCKLKGCEVYATAGSDEKLAFMKEQGADHVINYNNDDYVSSINQLLKGDRLDATFNAIAGSTYKKDMKLVGSGGKVLLYGGSERSGKKWGIFSTLAFVKRMGIIIPIGLMMQSKSLIGVNMLAIGDNKPDVLNRCLTEVTKLVLSGDLNPHVGAKYNVKDIAKAHSFLEGRASIGKVAIFWK